jgi:hypothetical protein
VEANLLLHIGEREIRIPVAKTIVKAQEQPLQLRHDRVLVVARISDQRAAVRASC